MDELLFIPMKMVKMKNMVWLICNLVLQRSLDLLVVLKMTSPILLQDLSLELKFIKAKQAMALAKLAIFITSVAAGTLFISCTKTVSTTIVFKLSLAISKIQIVNFSSPCKTLSVNSIHGVTAAIIN